MCQEKQYVVTFAAPRDRHDTRGLRRMPYADAERLLALASRIPKHGAIVEVND